MLSYNAPFEKLFQIKPHYTHQQVFGSTYIVLLLPHERSKLSPHSAANAFLGNGIEYKGYCCYDSKANRLHISCQVTFFEHVPFLTLPASSSLPDQPFLVPIDPFPSLFPIDAHVSSVKSLQVYHHPAKAPLTNVQPPVNAPPAPDADTAHQYPLCI